MTLSLPLPPDDGVGPTILSLEVDLGREIGRGQGLNSQVFLGLDRQLDAQFAVKRIPKEKLPPSYFDEARNLYYARHRNVVEIRYAGQKDEYVFLAMPYYRGGTLQSLLESRYLTTREIVRYAIEFLSGLNHVHVRRLIHFDVKPTNIFFDDSNTATLADFGLSREMDSTGHVLRWTVYGRHRPPEFAPASMRVSKAADIYQAGLTIYRMCVGHTEFERQVAAHRVDEDHNCPSIANGTFPDRDRFPAHIPNRLRRIVSQALEIDPARRFSTTLEMMNALALVDESLDWHYQEGTRWGEGIWTESGPASSRRVGLSSAGALWDVTAAWVFKNGKERRFKRFTKSGLPEKVAVKLVQQALTEKWGR